VLTRLATVRRSATAATPTWIEDAIWIEQALRDAGENTRPIIWPDGFDRCPFEDLFVALAIEAETRLWSGLDTRASGNLMPPAHAALRHALVSALSKLCSPALYERFTKLRSAAAAAQGTGDPQQTDRVTSTYDRFVADLRGRGLRQLFEQKPVLLRLIAVTVRQWIDVSREFVLRLDADLDRISRDFFGSSVRHRVVAIAGDLSDPHNGGHCVQIVSFEDGSRVVYKPKDLRLDAAWEGLVGRLNKAGPPAKLRAVRVVVREGYGWTEFIEHTGCDDADGAKRFFERAGAWLALFHCFAGTDMHQENMIAAGDDPVPIDLEMILQAAYDEQAATEPEAQAYEAAKNVVANSVMMVGLLPAYAKSPENSVFAIGGMTSDWTARTKLVWTNVNTDAMRPAKTKTGGDAVPNLPHFGGRYAKLGDHLESFMQGFENYAMFLMKVSRDANQGGLFENFSGLSVRKVIRPTRFYYLLLGRLRDHQSMHDGAIWSAQADFLTRFADWENHSDALWPLQRAERAALEALNVPHFVSPSDGNGIADAAGITVRTTGISGLERARARMRTFDAKDIAWQVAVIRQNTAGLSRSGELWRPRREAKLLHTEVAATRSKEKLVAVADKVADDLHRYGVRRGPGAAFIGLDWLGDSEVGQLVPFGPGLYNGLSGVAVFLAAHVAVTGLASSRELGLATIVHLRKSLKSRNAARMARSVGTGGGTGLGSIIYALALIAKFLEDDTVTTDAHAAAELFTDDLIAADKQLDVMSGSAGAILGLMRLYRDTRSPDLLERAIKCGEHLLSMPRHGTPGRRTWVGQGVAAKPLNGMAHGAAGFAYALAMLSAATGREEFGAAAAECVAFENSSYDAEHSNWPDFRPDEGPTFPCQWCHGAIGIGLARLAMSKSAGENSGLDATLATDIDNALVGVKRRWPGHVDTMCCGTLGAIEFFCESGEALARDDLRDAAGRWLMAVVESAAAIGDYRWNIGERRFNLGLFRGLAGVGYTCLRQADRSLPNVLIWE